MDARGQRTVAPPPPPLHATSATRQAVHFPSCSINLQAVHMSVSPKPVLLTVEFPLSIFVSCSCNF